MNLWSNRKARYTVCAAGAAVLVVPVGIGVAVANSAATSPQAPVQALAAPATKIDIQKLPDSVLLSSSQLGSGWKVIDPDEVKKAAGKEFGSLTPEKVKSMLGDISVTPSSCADLLSVPEGNDVTGVAARGFKKGSSMFGPYAGQAVVEFTDAAAAASALANARTVAQECSSVTVTSKYGPTNAVVTPINVPDVGQDRVGYRINASLAGFVSISAQVTAVQKGNRVVIVGQAGAKTSSALTNSLTTKAAARV